MFDLRQAQKPKVERVEIPELGGAVYVRAMESADADAHEAEQFERNKSGTALDNFRARLVVRCICDEAGNLLYTAADAGALGKQPASIIKRIFEAAISVNRMSAEDIEALEKN